MQGLQRGQTRSRADRFSTRPSQPRREPPSLRCSPEPNAHRARELAGSRGISISRLASSVVHADKEKCPRLLAAGISLSFTTPKASRLLLGIAGVVRCLLVVLLLLGGDTVHDCRRTLWWRRRNELMSGLRVVRRFAVVAVAVI